MMRLALVAAVVLLLVSCVPLGRQASRRDPGPLARPWRATPRRR